MCVHTIETDRQTDREGEREREREREQFFLPLSLDIDSLLPREIIEVHDVYGNVCVCVCARARRACVYVCGGIYMYGVCIHGICMVSYT